MSTDLNHNRLNIEPNELKQENSITIDSSSDVEDLKKRVLARRQCILDEGMKHVGVSPECSPKKVPDWYDPVAFRRAQKLYRTFGVVIRVSQFYGLMLVLNFYTGVTPLLVTGNSQTISQLYTRYLSTLVHVHNWYTYDPFDASTKSYRSLKIVRAYHRQVALKLNQLTGSLANGRPFLWMNQWGMAHAQFTFMGFMTVFPDQLGFRLMTSEDFHAMFHFWRVIGYCLGIEDRFNLCSGTDEEIFEHCKQNYREEWIPVLKAGDPTGVAMGNGIARAMSQVVPGIRYRGMLRFSAPFFGLDPSHYQLRGFWDYSSFALLWLVVNVYARSRIMLWFAHSIALLTIRIAIWLRGFNAWRLRQKYDSKYKYETDASCPFKVEFNYKTAFDMKLD